MQYQWMDDPNSTILPQTGVPPIQSGPDTTTYSGLEVVNVSDQTEADVGIWMPFVEVKPFVETENGGWQSLTWDNGKDGWFTPNFINANGQATGESLLITAQIQAPGSQTTLDPQHVAEISGDVQYPLNTDDLRAYEQVSLSDWPLSLETTHQGDKLPFVNIGAVAPGQSGAVSFNLAFTAHWGGKDLGAVQTNGWEATLVPDTGHPT